MALELFGRTINKIGVIGSGNIGPDIALFFSKVLHKNGSWVTVELKVSPIMREGRVVNLQGLLRDVTEKASLREEVRRLNEIINARVA